MKLVSFCLFFIGAFYSFSQSSYQFEQPLPPAQSNLKSLPTFLFGTYQSPNLSINYEINANGIFTVSNNFMSLSRAAIRESSKYEVREGYLFGLNDIDSVPCVLQGEFYHFALRHKDQLVGDSSKNILRKLDNDSYVLNFFENGAFTPALLTFKDKKLIIQYFSYEDNTKVFESITNQRTVNTSSLSEIYLNPNAEEFKKLSQRDYLGKQVIYSKTL